MTFPISKAPWNKGKLVGQKLPLKMQVEYISFSAHTDYKQTSNLKSEE